MYNLFEITPKAFSQSTQNLALGISISLIVILGLGVFLLRKRREFIKLDRNLRVEAQKAFKIDFVLAVIVLLLVLSRVFQIPGLSMRVLPAIVVLAMLVILGVYGLRAKKSNSSGQVKVKTTSVDEYSKYLPHKKKK